MEKARRTFKKAIQQGRSERKPEAYCFKYVEGLSEARTKLGGVFNVLISRSRRRCLCV